MEAILSKIDFHTFEAAGQEILTFLHRRLGFDLWMVTRTQDEHWIVLQSEDHGYGVRPGKVFRWADSFCSRMVTGLGPRIAPDSDAVGAYKHAPIADQVDIRAYIGAPLVTEDGKLFGTLCAIDPQLQPPEIVEEAELIDLLAFLLSKALQADLRGAEAQRLKERLEAEAQTDALTGLYNRRAWDALMSKEEERCIRYGHTAAVLAVDVDGLKQINDTFGHNAGDGLIVRAAQAMRKAARDGDIVARLGGDEFGILAIECNDKGAQALIERLEEALTEAQVSASVGMAIRVPTTTLPQAWEVADAQMYTHKRQRKGLFPTTM